VRDVQSVSSPTLTMVMKGLSFLGTEWFFLAALPLIYWCVDRRQGARISFVFLFSSFLNLWVKDLCGQPRPFQLDPKVGLASETSFGFPSGHAQGSIVFWGAAAKLFRKAWGLILAIALPLLVGLSRVYLGVHFPTDVFGGWLIGGVLLVLYYVFGRKLESLASKLNPRFTIIGAAALALIMNALDMRDTSISGVFLGAVAGFALVPKRLPFKTEGPLGTKVLRLLVGFAGAAVLYLGLKAVFPGQGSASYALFRFLRYGLLGIWVSLGAPWVFFKLHLVELESLEGEVAAAS
jgi:membrane-associated phospholipid phosphatase